MITFEVHNFFIALLCVKLLLTESNREKQRANEKTSVFSALLSGSLRAKTFE
jgi:hypothetical protein